ncbi:O-antigen ligase family protein [Candidatus Omnitrophota bacterium]
MKNLINLWKNSKLEEKVLWLYIVLVPFTGVSHLYIGMKKVGYADFVFAGLFLIFLIKYLSKKAKLPGNPMTFSFILMFSLFSLSLFNSVNLFDSFVEIAGLIYLISLFALVINIVSTSQSLRYFLNTHLFISTIISLAGLFFFCSALVTGNIKNNPFLAYTAMESMAHLFPRIKMTFETSNMLLTYLHVSLIVGIVLFLWEKRPRIKVFVLFSIAVILIAAFFTGSRRFTGVLLSLFLVLHWFGRGRVVPMLKYVFFAGFTFFVIASIITSIWVIFPFNITKDEVTKNIALKVNDAYSLHFIQPVTSVNMFKKHPIIGAGFGTYNKNFKDNVDWEWFRSSFGFDAYPKYKRLVENRAVVFDPHSVFLGTLAETGLAGFLGLMYFFFKYIMLLLKRFRASDRYSTAHIISGSILAGFIGFLLNGIITDILSMRHFWIMISIGMIGFLYREGDRVRC